MALDKPIPVEGIEEEALITSKTYKIDWEKGRILGKTDGQEAVKQFIKKAILTPRFRCLIYDNQYGSEIKEVIIEEDASREYIETEIQFLIKDTLMHDERILDVYNIEVEFSDDYLNRDSVIIRFDVDTIYGTISEEEVM